MVGAVTRQRLSEGQALRTVAKNAVREKTLELLSDYVRAGKPLPLAVMLENMNRFRDMALEAEGTIALMQSASRGDDEILAHRELANVARIRAQECAKDAANFMHPKLAQVQVSGDSEEPVVVLHAHAVLDRIRDRSESDLARICQAIAAGETVPELIEDGTMNAIGHVAPQMEVEIAAKPRAEAAGAVQPPEGSVPTPKAEKAAGRPSTRPSVGAKKKYPL